MLVDRCEVGEPECRQRVGSRPSRLAEERSLSTPDFASLGIEDERAPACDQLGRVLTPPLSGGGMLLSEKANGESGSTAYPDTGVVRPRSNAQHRRNGLLGPLRTPTPRQCRSSACAVGSVSPIHASRTHSGASPMGRRVIVICMPGCWHPDQTFAMGRICEAAGRCAHSAARRMGGEFEMPWALRRSRR